MKSKQCYLQEDAKNDWISLVKKHRRKQKGLPALSKLNTNAGNVEKNIEMFNDMQPDGIATVDAINGTISAASCCESLDLFDGEVFTCEDHQHNVTQTDLDDKFDMSMRTLL